MSAHILSLVQFANERVDSWVGNRGLASSMLRLLSSFARQTIEYNVPPLITLTLKIFLQDVGDAVRVFHSIFNCGAHERDILFGRTVWVGGAS